MLRVLKRLHFFGFLALLAGCRERPRNGTPYNPALIFCDYRITGAEDQETVNCLFQFKTGGPEGKSLLLQPPSKVQLDGQILPADSAGLSGVLYEVSRPLGSFKGRHEIIYTDHQGKPHPLYFSFLPFTLAAPLPEKLDHPPLTLRFRDLPGKKTPLRLSLTDTAFATNDINEIIQVQNGELILDRDILERLKPGPLVLELVKEEETSLEGDGNLEGRLITSYGLRRSFNWTGYKETGASKNPR